MEHLNYCVTFRMVFVMWGSTKERNLRLAIGKDHCSLFVFVAAAACLWLIWRRLFLEAWLLGSTVLLALTTSVESMPRYVMANPVFLLVAGDVIDRIQSRRARIGLAAASVLLQGFLLSQWMISSTLLM